MDTLAKDSRDWDPWVDVVRRMKMKKAQDLEIVDIFLALESFIGK